MVAQPQHKLTLLRAPERPPHSFDEQQQRVIAHRGTPLVVIGGPGTGKSATLVARVHHYIENGVDPNNILVLTFDRHRASELNDEIFAQSKVTTSGSLVKTFPALAFALIRLHRAQHKKRAPRLRTGPEQEYVIRELLAGAHEQNRYGWPEHLREASQTRAFATQLRELISRAIEQNVTSTELANMGASQNFPLWKSAASFFKDYRQSCSIENENAYDPSEMIFQATELLRSDAKFRRDIRSRHQVILVDEFHESDPAHRRLLDEIYTDELTLYVDPDSAVGRFRGADPESIPEIFERYHAASGAPATKFILTRDYRSVRSLNALSNEIAKGFTYSRLTEHRARSCERTLDDNPDALEVAQSESVHDEARFIAQRFHQLHLRDGIAYSEMAVIIRSPSLRATTLRRVFASMNIPVREEIQSLPLNAQPAVAPLIAIAQLAFALNRISNTPERINELLPNHLIDELLLSPYGGADFLTLKRIRATVINARAEDDSRTSYQIMREYLTISRAEFDWSEFAPLKRIADLISIGRKAARFGATSEDVLWAIWSGAKDEEGAPLALSWQRDAIEGDESADQALDGVLALFEAAARYADQFPGNTEDAFIRQLVHESIASDTIAAKAQRSDVVSILTTHAAKGRQWSVVAVAGVEEGIWPNLTPRGSLLGSERLVESKRTASATDRTAREFQLAALSALKDDERRLFYNAITRASRHLIITASAAEESRPSQYFNEVVEFMGLEEAKLTTHNDSTYLTPARLVARLRTLAETNLSAHAPEADRAISILAHLHRAGVRVANPDTWYGARELTTDQPLFADAEQITISPSSLDTLKKCPLKWAFEYAGGRDSDSTAQILGVALHFVATRLIKQTPLSQLLTELELIWGKLAEQTDLAKGWYGKVQLERAKEILTHIFTYHSNSQRELVAVEAGFSLTLGRTVINGSIDRVEKKKVGDEITAYVVDLKTGDSAVKQSEAEENMQLQVYQLAVNLGAFAKLLPEAVSAGAELFYPAVNVAGATRTQDAIENEQVIATIDSMSSMVAATTFLAVENEMCRSCNLRKSCPIRPEGRGLND